MKNTRTMWSLPWPLRYHRRVTEMTAKRFSYEPSCFRVTSVTDLSPAARECRSIFVSAPDGLRLHVREYGQADSLALSVVCLPGLARTTADFDVLAPALAYDEPRRRVIAIDSRGRGQSEYDATSKNYNLTVELADLVAVLIALDIKRAVFIGSSRGGILTMLLAATHPEMIAGAVLHDIGPVIEPEGVARIKTYVGKLRQPQNFEEGADILHGLFAAQFPNFTAEQWLSAAQRTWKLQTGELLLTYDPALAESLAEFDIEHPLSSLWNEFEALARVPVLVIRGARSDILSTATLNAMRARHPGLESIEVPDQGHVPLLEGAELVRRVTAFIEKCERTTSSRSDASGLGGGRGKGTIITEI
jgi:pimeloyl-ACP methyl ester carboxylesterase